MTDHFKLSLKVIAAALLLLIGGYFWLRHRILASAPSGLHATLPNNDKELIHYDENRHRITVTTDKGTTTMYSRNPTVEIRKDGTVKTDAHKFGTEIKPFWGGGWSDTGRGYVGLDLFYAGQFDAGLATGWTANNRYPNFQPVLCAGWNFWRHTSLNVGVNPVPYMLQHKPEIALFLSTEF